MYRVMLQHLLYMTMLKNIIILYTYIPRWRGNGEGVEFHNRGITAIGGPLRCITAIGAHGSYIPLPNMEGVK